MGRIRKKKAVWNKKIPDEPMSRAAKKRLAESDKGSYYNQDEWLQQYHEENLVRQSISDDSSSSDDSDDATCETGQTGETTRMLIVRKGKG